MRSFSPAWQPALQRNLQEPVNLCVRMMFCDLVLAVQHVRELARRGYEEASKDAA